MQPLLSRIIRLIDWLGWLYIAAIGLWLILRLLFFDQFWWLALANTFAIVLFVPLAALLPWALFRRRRSLLLGVALPLGVFLWLYGATLLPPLARAEAAPPQLTVMSYNVLWKNHDYDRLAAAIAADRPDIVALQELRPEHMPELRSRLGADYPYYLVQQGDLYHTVGVLSRFPFDAVEHLNEAQLTRGLRLELSPHGRPLTVIVTHLTATNMFDYGRRQLPTTVAERYAQRHREVRELINLAHSTTRPVLILCDCNLTPTSEAYAMLNAELNDSFATAGWGFGNTFLEPWLSLPAVRIDYIWHSDDLRALTAFVGADGRSDHLPIVARLAWRLSAGS